MKVIVILATLVVAACGGSSAPSAPNFVVISTDWRTTLIDPGTQSTERCPPTRPGDLPAICQRIPGRSPTYQYTAHGIFRNQGGSGSAVVTFQEPPTLLGPTPGQSCNAVVKADAGQIAEASCPMPGGDINPDSPPIAKVSPNQ